MEAKHWEKRALSFVAAAEVGEEGIEGKSYGHEVRECGPRDRDGTETMLRAVEHHWSSIYAITLLGIRQF